MKLAYLRLGLPAAALLALGWLSCKGGDRAASLQDQNQAGASGIGAAGRGGAAGTSADESDAGVDASVDASVAGSNCGRVVCRGAGQCVEVDGVARCICDTGYILQGGECVVDETCINLRRLERACRQRTGSEPAIGMFFGLETCAGTSVRPEILGDVSQAFRVKEDGFELDEESYATIFDRSVESFVMVALDLSGSLVTDPDLLVPVIEEMKNFYQALEPAPGAAPVSAGLMVFGRSVHLIRDMTSDFSLLLADLDAIQANPSDFVTETGGTNLIGALNGGVAATEQAQEGRFAETLGAVLSVGTMVTVTDGRDTSGDRIEAPDTLVNRISIGISGEINDVELSRVGPEGSFLAPEPDDWAQAFQRVAQRVREYPERAYVLSYCSPAVAGNHTVAVTLKNRVAAEDATCSFRADDFGVGVASCNAEFLDGYCSARTCGSFLACGPGCETDGGVPEQAPGDLWIFSTR